LWGSAVRLVWGGVCWVCVLGRGGRGVGCGGGRGGGRFVGGGRGLGGRGWVWEVGGYNNKHHHTKLQKQTHPNITTPPLNIIHFSHTTTPTNIQQHPLYHTKTPLPTKPTNKKTKQKIKPPTQKKKKQKNNIFCFPPRLEVGRCRLRHFDLLGLFHPSRISFFFLFSLTFFSILLPPSSPPIFQTFLLSVG